MYIITLQFIDNGISIKQYIEKNVLTFCNESLCHTYNLMVINCGLFRQ